MGVISILLGIITFFFFTGIGAIIANLLVDYKTTLALSITSLNTVSNAAMMAVVVGFFVFIGLLVGMNLIMHGLTYNKLSNLSNDIRRS